MRVRFSQLREMVRGHLLERAEEPRDVILSDGETVRMHSTAHVKDMQAVMDGLAALKKQHKYGSAARAHFAAAHGQLKRILQRAEANSPSDDLDEAEYQGDAPEEPRTFSKLEGEMSPGRTGYGRGAMAPQYDPAMAVRKP